jgi:hypothetical protein
VAERTTPTESLVVKESFPDFSSYWMEFISPDGGSATGPANSLKKPTAFPLCCQSSTLNPEA